ncbi:hypothetical protein [Nocardia araoensis]|uniref:hypothetical protein n=1 Tax=Nocardia araoensis TaxID=228600 RepID=UPI0002FF6D94|nr:hypothetical protein [Nocardia araoensis]
MLVEDAAAIADSADSVDDITVGVRTTRFVTCGLYMGSRNGERDGMTGAITGDHLCQQTFRTGQVCCRPADLPGIGTGQSGFPGCLCV